MRPPRMRSTAKSLWVAKNCGPSARPDAMAAKVDFRVEQEFPGFGDDHRGSVFLLIKNLGNLINDEWGILKESSFPRYQGVVEFPNSGPPFFNDAGIDAQGRYLFEDFNAPAAFVANPSASLYEIRLGIKYNF